MIGNIDILVKELCKLPKTPHKNLIRTTPLKVKLVIKIVS